MLVNGAWGQSQYSKAVNQFGMWTLHFKYIYNSRIYNCWASCWLPPGSGAPFSHVRKLLIINTVLKDTNHYIVINIAVDALKTMIQRHRWQEPWASVNDVSPQHSCQEFPDINQNCYMYSAMEVPPRMNSRLQHGTDQHKTGVTSGATHHFYPGDCQHQKIVWYFTPINFHINNTRS